VKPPVGGLIHADADSSGRRETIDPGWGLRVAASLRGGWRPRRSPRPIGATLWRRTAARAPTITCAAAQAATSGSTARRASAAATWLSAMSSSSGASGARPQPPASTTRGARRLPIWITGGSAWTTRDSRRGPRIPRARAKARRAPADRV